MDAISPSSVRFSTAIDRKRLRATATNCGQSEFYQHCKVLWPENTAAHLAVAAKCQPRMAEYYLGKANPPERAWLTLLTEILARRSK